MEAVALLSDVKGSRTLQSRQPFFEDLRKDLAALNQTYDGSIIAPLEFQKGLDELGAILRPGGDIGSLLVDLWLAFHPIEARFALVQGPLDIAPSTEEASVHLYDGPALHAASEAIASMKQADQPIHLGSEEGDQDEHASLFASLLYLNILDWTPRQLEVFEAHREGQQQTEIADLFGITQPTVSELLSKTRARFTSVALEAFIEDARDLFQEGDH